MKKSMSIGLIIVASVIIIADLIFIVHGNLTWSKNMSPFLGIMAMICVIIGMTIQIRYDNKQKTKLTDNHS